MILSDNETIIDQLNNLAIAKTIVSIVNESDESVSIGVHGDWGAGKSSVLAMVEDELNSNEENDNIDDWDEVPEIDWNVETDEELTLSDLATIRFNSWQFQGFEDAKIALMSAIVCKLEKKAKAYYQKHKIKGGLNKLKEISKRLWGNLDKLSIVKKAGGIGISLATGTTSLALADMLYKQIANVITDKNKAEDIIEMFGRLVKEPVSEISGFKEMEEFRNNFKDLFDEARIKKLVVLIDDLDRCLPKVAIETLEAVRMFLSLDNTAFIIAADDLMIRYAVKEYFPRVIEQEANNQDMASKIDYNRFSDKYLEKLVQIPFHIPRVGLAEAQLYTMLLLIESKIGKSDELTKLVEIVLKKLSKPWALEQLSTEEIKMAMGEKYPSVVENVKIAKSIGRILAENTNGNPRNIKRFVNMLLLRTKVAHNRGFSAEELEISVLAKMMLAEQYNSDFYKELAAELDNNGICSAFEIPVEKESAEEVLEEVEVANGSEQSTVTGKAKKVQDIRENIESPKTVTVKNESFRKYLEMSDIREWMDIEPSLANVDLRPYFFACTQKQDFFFSTPEERLRELIVVIRGGKMNAANNKGKFINLSEADAKKLFKLASQDAFTKNLTESKPIKQIEGIRCLVEYRPELQEDLVGFLLTLPVDKLGIWATGGWDACIPKTSPVRQKLNQFFKEIEINGANSLIKESARRAQGL